MEYREFGKRTARNRRLTLADLKRIRRAGGFTLRDIAKKCGVSHTTVAGWENGNRIPQPENIKLYASALGLDPIDLLNLKDKPGPDSVFYGRKPAATVN